jgi:hypothetical protein
LTLFVSPADTDFAQNNIVDSDAKQRKVEMHNVELENELFALEAVFEELADDQTDEEGLGVMVAYGGGYSCDCLCW